MRRELPVGRWPPEEMPRAVTATGTATGTAGPVSLTAAQLVGAEVKRVERGIPVVAWVPWTDGTYHRVEAFAGEWTSSAAHLRWREGDAVMDVWVWSAGVQRRPPPVSSGGVARR